MTVIAIVAFGSTPVIAEPGLRQPASGSSESPPNESTPSPADSSVVQQSVAQQQQSVTQQSVTQQSVAQQSVAQQSIDQRLDRLQTGINLRQQLNQSRFRHADRSIGIGADSLQLQQELQQQLQLQDDQQLRRNVSTSPSRSLDLLQFEQRVRQQIRQQPDDPQSRMTLAQANPVNTADSDKVPAITEAAQPAAITPSSEPIPSPQPAPSPETPDTEAASAAPSPTTTSSATASGAAASIETPSTPQAEATDPTNQTSNQPANPANQPGTSEQPNPVAEDLSEPAPDLKDQATVAEARANEGSPTEVTAEERKAEAALEAAELPGAVSPEAVSPEAVNPETVSPETVNPEAVSPERVSPETVVLETEAPGAENAEVEVSETTAAESPEAESSEAVENSEEAENSQDTADREPEDQPSEEDEEAAETPAPKPDRTTAEAEDRIDRQNRDYPTDPEAPAPEYLDPNPNPLSFPTTPEEVELVGTQPITIQQAIELALRNNSQLRQAQFELEQSQAALRETQAAALPTVDATAGFNQIGREQTTFPQNPLTGETGDAEVIYTDSTALGADLEVRYPIYTSGRIPALLRASRGQIRLRQLEVERQTEQLILDTSLDYYDLQQASAQVKIFTANLAQSERSLQDAQALERAGVGTRFDVLQAEVDVANARQELTQQLSQLDIARRQLAQRLNVAQTVNLEAADTVEVAGVWDLSLGESIVQAYKNRAELEQQLIQREIAQDQRRAALAQLGPQVSFIGGFGLDNDLDRDPGFIYNYRLGLNVQMSLYDGGLARAQADQRESDISIAEAEFENIRDQIRFQVEQAYSQLDANFANIQTTALAVEQAAEALRLARLRFQAGVGTQTDVLRQQTALAQSQVNNIRAILDYNRAITQLQRQISNYPEGFLNEQP
jgi:outer membrane protein TolC